MTGKQQLKSQALLQRAQVSEERAASIRELRRSAYVAVLNQHSVVERAMRGAWEETPCVEFDSSGRYAEIVREVNLLQEKLHLAELEGPLDVATRAARIMAFESQSIANLVAVVESNGSSNRSPEHCDSNMSRDDHDGRINVRDAFIDTARDMLGTTF
ncbi:hypothetical protein WDV06_22215 [Streptomyces racemochromogenes]|uniref:Uncharacterized protein n=1 Tax=Streptomyces racemochromogenes TaxID=67353 RepID=A0ABW7PHD0_9ACTN